MEPVDDRPNRKDLQGLRNDRRYRDVNRICRSMLYLQLRRNRQFGLNTRTKLCLPTDLNLSVEPITLLPHTGQTNEITATPKYGRQIWHHFSPRVRLVKLGYDVVAVPC